MAATPATPPPAYEELRRRKLEENKRKLEELRVGHLVGALREAAAAATPKPSPSKRRKMVASEGSAPAVLRRSDRLANLPEQPKYSDMDTHQITERMRRSYGRSYKARRDLSHRVYASDEAREYAISQAEEVESELGSEFPTFLKPMLQSHTTGGFWLGLPNWFCVRHLPKKDETITLVDEDGNESDTFYLSRKKGLSAGWRGFSIEHGLVDGDCLVFQLIKPTKFQVHIIRASSYYEK